MIKITLVNNGGVGSGIKGHVTSWSAARHSQVGDSFMEQATGPRDASSLSGIAHFMSATALESGKADHHFWAAKAHAAAARANGDSEIGQRHRGMYNFHKQETEKLARNIVMGSHHLYLPELKKNIRLVVNGGPGSGIKGHFTDTPKRVGDWVTHPVTGKRGIVGHIYEDNKNAKGRLLQVDYGAGKPGEGDGRALANHREGDVQFSNDQKSKWADKPFERGSFLKGTMSPVAATTATKSKGFSQRFHGSFSRQEET